MVRGVRDRADTAGVIGMRSRTRSMLIEAASCRSRNCSAAFIPAATRLTAASRFPRGFDVGANNVSCRQVMHSGALGSALIAFVEQTRRVPEFTGVVESSSPRSAPARRATCE